MEGYRFLPGLRPLDLPAWEKKLGLPAHRIEGASRSSVFAYKNEFVLTILDGKGRELWHFKAGRELKFGNKVFLEFPKSKMPASG
jgi:hypothetical protein